MQLVISRQFRKVFENFSHSHTRAEVITQDPSNMRTSSSVVDCHTSSSLHWAQTLVSNEEILTSFARGHLNDDGVLGDDEGATRHQFFGLKGFMFWSNKWCCQRIACPARMLFTGIIVTLKTLEAIATILCLVSTALEDTRRHCHRACYAHTVVQERYART
jgi:hypothetical protein